MIREEAEKLLGGHATGTLSEEERRTLFAAALKHQEVFDALMEEEALRELLADPEARARLLAALAAAPPKVVPFWLHPGVIGAAASLLVAATAGLAYLRNPQALPPLERREKAQDAAPRLVPVPAAAQPAGEPPARPRVQSLAPLAPQDAPALKAKEEAGPLREAAPRALPTAPVLAPAPKSAPPLPAPPRPAAAMEDVVAESAKAAPRRIEVTAHVARAAEAKKLAVQPRPTAGGMNLTPGLVGGMVGGVVGGAAGAPPVQPSQAAAERADRAAVVEVIAEDTAPTWTLVAQSDGATRITVMATRGALVVVLKRGASGVELLKLVSETRDGKLAQWRGQVRLAPGDALDLYLLNAPVADPTKLPAVGPVDGYRARIHPARK